jgi:putative ABC transport system permease protein
MEVNEQHFEYWRRHARSFESLAQYIVLPANLTGAGEAAQVFVARASGSIFDVLRVQASLGRTLSADDEPSDQPETIVLTDAFWRQRFGSDPSIVGRIVSIDGRPRTIVGVLPADFRLPTERLSLADAFVPIHMDRSNVGWEGDHNDEAIGRLPAGVTPEQAQAELDVLQAQVSEIATREAKERVTLVSAVQPLAETITGRARRGLLLLLGAIGAVLLVACSNLANLSLTRATGRLRDAGIRSALGASRARLAGRAAIEQLVLSAVGGGLGVAVAWAALDVFVHTAPIDLPRAGEVAIDVRVLLFAASVSMLAGAVVAVLPAWRTAHGDVEQTLRAGALTTTSDRSGVRTRSVLLALQVALSLTLLVATALLVTSFARLVTVDRGFAAEQVLVVPVSLPSLRYETDATRQAAYDRMIADLGALPGVVSATALSVAPLTGSAQVNPIAPEGSTRPRSEQPSANFRFVGTDFFRTLGIGILRGRAFAEADRGHMMPAVISQSAARSLFPDRDALGRHFSRGIPGEDGFEVVGIVADIRLTSLDRTPPLMVYLPYWWRSRASLTLLVRSATQPEGLMTGIRRAVRDVDADIAIGDAKPLDRVVTASVAGRRYQMELFVAFGAVALFIATLGVYAVTSYGVARRRREMNIRVALGARRGQVLGLVVRQGVVPMAVGLAAGTAGAFAIGSVVGRMLFGVRPHDPRVISAAVALVASTGIATCLFAAMRGLRLDPTSALREE